MIKEEICELTELPEEMCSHCQGHDDVIDPCEGLKIIHTIRSKYDGSCCIDRDHDISRKDIIGKVKIEGEPDINAFGYACANCTKRVKAFEPPKPKRDPDEIDWFA